MQVAVVFAGTPTNTSSATQIVTVVDNIAPVLVGVPANTTATCTSVSELSAPTVTATDNCGTATVTTSSVTTPGNCPGNYTITHTWIAVDAYGNSSTSSQTISVSDNTAPILVGVPSNTTATCTSVPSAATVTATDNCGIATVVMSSVTNAGNCPGNYTITRTWTATDQCGNISSASQRILVIDNTAPELVGVPANITRTCQVGPGVAAIVTATDNCGTASVVMSEVTTLGNFAGNYIVTRTWTATDQCGNTSSALQVITVQDITAPVVPILSNVTGECSGTAQRATTTDACSGIVTGTTNDPLTYNTQGTYIIHWTFTDASGNSSTANQNVIIKDVTKPTIACPANITTTANTTQSGQAGSLVTYTATATDNCGTVTVTYSKTPGSFFPVGTTTVTATATDSNGNTSTCTFTVTVGCGASVVTVASVPTSNTYTGGASTSLFLGYGAQSTTLQVSATGTNTYLWTGAAVSKLSSNTTSNPVFTPTTAGNYTFTVQVTNSIGCKGTASISICVTDIRVVASTGSSHDDDEDNQTMCNHQEHDASDCSHKGHSHYCDHKAHSKYVCSHKETNDRDDDDQKNCDHKGHASKDCSHKGHNHKVCDHKAHATKDCDHDKSRATDDQKVCDHKSHNEIDCSHEGHHHKTCDHKVHTASSCQHKYGNYHHGDDDEENNKGVNGCDDDKQKMCNHQSHDASECSHKGHNHKYCDHKAHSKYDCDHKDTNDKDDDDEKDCDHKSHDAKDCSHKGHNHKVCDHKAHTTKDCDHDRSNGSDDQKVCDHKGHDAKDCAHKGHHHTDCDHKGHDAKYCSHNADYKECDNDDKKVYLCHVPPGNPGMRLTLSISVNAVASHLANHPGDRLGTCDQIPCTGFTDITNPVITCPPAITVNCGTSTTPSVTGSATATDNFGSIGITYTDVNGSGFITRTWKAKDAAGNFSTCVQTITLVDNVKPVIKNPYDITISCGSLTAPTACGTATATDNCSTPVVTYSDVTVGNVITRTWKATDAAGNFSTSTQKITIVDNIKPVITCPSDKVLSGCGFSTDPLTTGYPTATDNCSTPVITYSDVISSNGVIKRTWKATDASGNYSTCVQTITKPTSSPCVLPYPLADVYYPRSSVAFNESEILRATDPGPNNTCATTTPTQVKLWFNDEHPFTLGVRQVIVKTSSGTTTTNYPVTTFGGVASTVSNPSFGTTIDGGDKSGNDVAAYGGRPLRPVLYISDITVDPNNRMGDWQHNGTPYNPTRISGSWKSAVRMVDKTKTPNVITVIPDADPATKNNWNMGIGGDIAPLGLLNQGYGAEIVWDVASLNLLAGHTYRLQFIVHDGDQNKAGGDAGQACTILCVPTTPLITKTETPVNVVTGQAKTVTADVATKTTEEELKVTVMPNPSTTYFTIKLESKYETPVNMRVMDDRGRVVDAKSQIGANSTIQIGHNYSSGTYYAEMIQGTKRKVIQLIKAKG